ncbi:MAG TPA: O-antigen ligase family protein [Thermomicrobiales bacterium]|nr:O-antigen ligase family protein [Thermomicrobiales bacterium]
MMLAERLRMVSTDGARFGPWLLIGIGALLFAPLPTPVQLILVIGACVIAAVAGPAATLALVFAALPLWMLEIRIGTAQFGPLELALLLCLGSVAVTLCLDVFASRSIRPVAQWIPPADVTWLAISLLALGSLSLIWVADPGLRPDSVRALRRVIFEPLLVLPALAWLMPRDRVRNLLPWLGLPAVAVAGLALLQMATGHSTVEIGGIGRPTGPFTHPNNLSFYLERAIWFVPLAMSPIGRLDRRWTRIAVTIVLLGCLATLSRGASLALVAGAVIYFHAEARKHWQRLLTLSISLIVIAVGIRYLAVTGSSISTRTEIWRSAIAMLRDHPWTGVGLDQFLGQYGRRYVSQAGWPERYTSHPHNILLDFWLSLGIGGVIWLWALLERFWTRTRLLFDHQSGEIQRAALAMIVAGLAHGLLDNSFFLPDLATWTWIGLMLATPQFTRSEP